jgi:hypothetical protein
MRAARRVTTPKFADAMFVETSWNCVCSGVERLESELQPYPARVQVLNKARSRLLMPGRAGVTSQIPSSPSAGCANGGKNHRVTVR